MSRELINGKPIDDAKKNVTAAITHIKCYGAPPRPCTSGECELVSQYLMNIGLILKELDSATRAFDDCLHLVSDINALAKMNAEVAELDAQKNNQKKENRNERTNEQELGARKHFRGKPPLRSV